MARKTEWQERAHAFAKSYAGVFTLDTLLKKVGSGVSRRSLERFLFETGVAVSLDSVAYTPTPLLFRDAVCLAKPQKWEIDDGVFVPGHRFLPLYDFRLLPTELELRAETDTHSGGNGTTRRKEARGAVARRTIAVPLSRVVIYYTLFGQESFFPLLGFEDESNIEVDLEDGPNALVRISVFDLAEFYRRTEFSEGDYLECRLLDWEAGVFSVARRSAAETTHEQWTEWRREMEEAFRGVFEFFNEPMDIPTQLLYAYYMSDAAVLQNPGGTLGELLAADNDLQIVARGTTSSTIWNAPELPEQSFVAPGFDSPAEGVTGDLGEILADIGSTVAVGEIEAFMRDALFYGRKKEDAVGRAFAGAQLAFAHKAQAKSFRDEIDELWAAIAAEYVPAGDVITGPIRSRLLDLYDKQLAFIRGLDARGVDPSELPAAPMREMLQFFNMITNAIELLNQKVEGDQDQLETLMSQLPQLEEIAVEILEQAQEAVSGVPGEAPSETLSEAWVTGDTVADRASATEVFEFKISLADIKPQIWRRVRVPGSTTLAEFHDVIQLVMGWYDSHLHIFVVQGIPYASATHELPDALSDAQYRLADLGLKVKERFHYVYDFGDDWTHEILVSKILDVNEVKDADRTTPRVLSGKRAAPPEDCGGVSGYYRLLYYRDDADGDDADAESWREMVPENWDPERFDIKATNNLLRW